MRQAKAMPCSPADVRCSAYERLRSDRNGLLDPPAERDRVLGMRKRVTLYGLKAVDAHSRCRADGRCETTLTVAAVKG